MRRTFIAFVFCLLATNVLADQTGNDLKDYCRLYPRKTESTLLCTAYISGSIDMARAVNRLLKGDLVCEPPGVTGDQLIAMTIKYLADNPADLHLAAASLVLDMYTRAFPCKK